MKKSDAGVIGKDGAENTNLHIDHRKRLRMRFIKNGLSSFEPHNILELLLFFSIPRVDTNNIAHTLLERYKTLSAVFDADIEDLMRIPGIGENSAVLIKLIPELSRAYMMDKLTRYPNFGDLDKVGEYLTNYYIGAVRETVVLLLLNNNLELIDCVKLSEGAVNISSVNPRLIAEIGLRKNASCFILAHNHPDGNLTPSNDDIITTRRVHECFETLEMPMLEHIIVAGGKYRPILCGLTKKPEQ